METTLLLVIVYRLLQLGLVVAGAFVIYSIYKSIIPTLNPRESSAPDGSSTELEKPELPVASIIMKVAAIIVFVMTFSLIDIWMVRSDNTAPAVNATIRSQMMRDADRSVEIKGVIPSDADFEDKARLRENKAQSVKDSFKEIPEN